jgi:O-antigen/teichoic acid export membrane protein
MTTSWLVRFRRSALVRNTVWMFLGQGLRLTIQGGCFVIIARSLGASGYGAFVGAAALVAIFAPFATLGFGSLLVKNVARDRRLFRDYWGNTLLMTFLSGCVLLVFVTILARFILPASIPTLLVILVAASDLLASRLTDVTSLAFQGLEEMRWTAIINILLSTVRLVGAIIFAATWNHPTALDWSYLYCATSMIAAAFSVCLATKQLGKPRVNLARIVPELAEGFHFSAGLSAQTIYNDIDKTMLSRFADLGSTGIYAVAYRLIDVAFVPVRSLLYAASPGCFRAGGGGVNTSILYMKRLLPRVIAYTLCVFFVLTVCAPLVPHVLGSEYTRTVEALRWLALLPVLRAVHLCYGDALTGAGYQGLRMVLQAVVAIFNVLINLWLIPAYSWRGAVGSSLASDFLLLVAVVSAATVLCSRENQKPAIAVTYP